MPGDQSVFSNYWKQLNPSLAPYDEFFSFWEREFYCKLDGSVYILDYFDRIGIENVTVDSDGSIFIPNVTVLVSVNDSTIIAPTYIPGTILSYKNVSEDEIELLIAPSNPFKNFQRKPFDLCSDDISSRPKLINCRCTGKENLLNDMDIDVRRD